jgi:uncharacterized protein (DUF697 family)
MKNATISIKAVIGNNTYSEYAERLASLLRDQGYDAETWALSDYKNMQSSIDSDFPDEKFIFIGEVPNFLAIETSAYSAFACFIGWKANACVIKASDVELSGEDYETFRSVCANQQNQYPDVIIPPEKKSEGVLAAFRGLFGANDTEYVHRAQYSVLIHIFFDNFLALFLSGEQPPHVEIDATAVAAEIKEESETVKERIKKEMTYAQVIWCNGIIHGAAVVAAAIAFVPIPVADAIPITSTQIGMVIALGKVFEEKISKEDASLLLGNIVAPLVGRAAVKAALVFVPGIGWGINSAIAASITEMLGWAIVAHFVKKG